MTSIYGISALSNYRISDVPGIIQNIKSNKVSYRAQLMHHGPKTCPECDATGEVYHRSDCKIAIDLIGTYTY